MEQNNIPIIVQNFFFKLFEKEISIKYFEEKLYGCSKLEDVNSNLYLELIALDYKKNNILYKVKEIIWPFLNFSEYEKRNIISTLKSLQKLDNKFHRSLNYIYQMNSDNYNFLKDLENYTYSLAFEIGVVDDKKWGKYSQENRERIVGNFIYYINSECEKIMYKIKHKEIILSGEFSEHYLNSFLY